MLVFCSISIAQKQYYDLDVRNAFFVLKSGEKISLKDGIIEVNQLSSKIYFRNLNNKQESISYKKLDYLSSDVTWLDYQNSDKYILKTFKFDKREDVFMVLAETADKRLITKTGKFSYDLGYKIFVVDKDGKKVDEINVYGGPKLKGYVHRSEIEPFLKRNFPICKDLLNRIPKVVFSDDIVGYSLFDKPIYIKCD